MDIIVESVGRSPQDDFSGIVNQSFQGDDSPADQQQAEQQQVSCAESCSRIIILQLNPAIFAVSALQARIKDFSQRVQVCAKEKSLGPLDWAAWFVESHCGL